MKTIQERLIGTTLMSDVLTHKRLKHLASMFSTSEDHISRLGMGLSIRTGPVNENWQPSRLANDQPLNIITGKSLRGKTLFKEDLPLWLSLVGDEVQKQDFSEYRKVFLRHWQRGVEILQSQDEGDDWLYLLQRLVEQN